MLIGFTCANKAHNKLIPNYVTIVLSSPFITRDKAYNWLIKRSKSYLILGLEDNLNLIYGWELIIFDISVIF